jgi:DNA-binding NtrC family response regulator
MPQPVHCTLIVDDDATHARMLVDGLSEAGWGAVAATRVEQALALLESGGYSLVVSDILMTDGDGFDLLRTIRTGGNRVPVILMSSFGSGGTPQQAAAAGAFAYLAKPFSLEVLLALVARAHENASP